MNLIEGWGKHNIAAEYRRDVDQLSEGRIICYQSGILVGAKSAKGATGHKQPQPIYISWEKFFNKTHSIDALAFHTTYQLTSAELKFVMWFYWRFIDKTARIYGVTKEGKYVAMRGTLAHNFLTGLLKDPNSSKSIDEHIRDMFDTVWFWALDENATTNQAVAGQHGWYYPQKKRRKKRSRKPRNQHSRKNSFQLA